MSVLLADIGGTNSRLCLADDSRQLFRATTYENRNFDSFEKVLQAFLDETADSPRPSTVALAIAGPVFGDRVQMVNLDWGFSRKELTAAFGFDRFEVLNDFSALAWATTAFRDADLVRVGGGAARPDHATAILGPGTGLGVSGLVPGPAGWSAVSGEGGHATLAAATRAEAEIIEIVRREYGHCSAERIVSGPGLALLHRVMWGPVIEPAEVSRLALDGNPEAQETLRMFFCFLGTVAGNLAVTLGALGGVYIAGGVVPQLADSFSRSGFRERFESKGRTSDYLAAIPTSVVIADYPAFTGLLSYLSRR